MNENICKNGHAQTPENVRGYGCRLCNNEKSRRNRVNNPKIRQYWLDRKLLDKYGITREQWQAVFDKQGGRCALCQRVFNQGRIKPCVDHCHKTGIFRGLLCHACNRGIGLLQESIEILSRASAYLTGPWSAF